MLGGLAVAVVAPRATPAPAPVTALAADGARVAYALGRSRSACDEVAVWDARTCEGDEAHVAGVAAPCEENGRSGLAIQRSSSSARKRQKKNAKAAKKTIACSAAIVTPAICWSVSAESPQSRGPSA